MGRLVVQCVNSIIGKTGNIGLRAGYIIDSVAHDRNIKLCTIARGATKPYSSKVKTQGLMGLLPRLFNAYRIYVDVNFDCRKYDLRSFDKFALKSVKNSNLGLYDKRIFHAWDQSIETIKYAKKNQFEIVLDVPIAPSSYSKKLDAMGLLGPIGFDLDTLISNERQCFNLVDRFIVPSEFVKDEILDYGISKEKINVINFGLKPNQVSSNIDRGQKHNVDFCFAGLINRRKGIKYLIEAFDDVAFDGDTLHLCGRLFKEERQLIKKTNNGNINVPGFVHTAEYFKKCDIYVFPSLMEGSSKSIFEAMGSGMPVITTPNSGSIVRDGIDGYIVPIGDSQQLKEKMILLKKDPLLRKQMGEAARDRVKDFTWDKYARNVIDVYRRV